MRVAVVGHGRMGHEVEEVLIERGHEPVVVAARAEFPRLCPVGIDFTRADQVLANVRRAMEAGARYVVGTTGWDSSMAEVRELVDAHRGALVHAANFSLGVNLFYKVVRDAAALFARFGEYDPYVFERHHRLKKDAPSGTARELAHILESAYGDRRAQPELHGALEPGRFHVGALRAGGIVGEHTVGFDSGGDEVLLEHRARTRKGFALGAVLAAEWIADRNDGVTAFQDALDDIAQGG